MIKRNIFNKYYKAISKAFEIDILEDTKRREYTEARFVLYYFCRENKMRIRHIQELLLENGYEVTHPAIIYGYNTIKSAIAEQDDSMMYIINSVKENIE